nr:transcription initiation factor IIB family protein [Candidatus Freyrarchaeum guaymaensis]
MESLKCPDCKVRVIIHAGEYVCPNCGLVIGYNMTSPLYRISSEEPIRGMWVNPEPQSGSYIGYEHSFIFKDSKGNLIPPNRQVIYKRLKVKAFRERLKALNSAHHRAISALRRVCDNLELQPFVRERAIYLYKYIVRHRKVSNNILLVAACLLYAIREQKIRAPVTLTELSNAFKMLGYNVTPKRLTKMFFLIRRITGEHHELRKSEEYIPRAINTLLESEEVIVRIEERGINLEEYKNELLSKCMAILSEISLKERGGRRPFTLAAAVIYCADKLISLRKGTSPVLTQRLVSHILGVAAYSLRDHYSTLLKSKYIKTIPRRFKQAMPF